jgi:hypothetical protein
MRVAISFLVVCVFQFFCPVHAQTKIVPMKDEPRHVKKLSNKYVRVIDLVLAPGEVTLYHEHTQDIATLVLSAAELTNQAPGVAPTKVSASVGRVVFSGYATKPVTHQVVNVGTTTFRIIGVEIVAPRRTSASGESKRGPAYELVLDNERVQIWRLRIGPGQSVQSENGALPCLRIVESGEKLSETPANGRANVGDLHLGDLKWQAGGSAAVLANPGNTPVVLVEVDVK